MIVVADTTPLHYLVILDHADVLQKLFGQIVVPEAVCRELQAANTPDKVKRWMERPPAWLEVRQVRVLQDPRLQNLDAGEREAIALAEALRADAIILDDRAARREAERRKLRVIGTLRILDDAAEAKLLDLPETLQRLRGTGFYLHPSLVEFLLKRDSDRQP